MLLTQEKAERLQRILSKRFGRSLSDIELESAYKSLNEYAVALVNLIPNDYVSSSIHTNLSQPITVVNGHL